MSTAVRRAIYGKLSGDSTLTSLLGTAAAGYSKAIYHDPAPQGAAYPFVVLAQSSGVPTDSFGLQPTGGVAYETDIWMVKAVDHNTTADRAESIADRIRFLLNDANLSISGGTLLYLRRQNDSPTYSEAPDGEIYRHAGSLYRLIHQ